MPYFYLTGSGSVAGLLILVKEPYQSSKGRARDDRIASRVTSASKGKDPSSSKENSSKRELFRKSVFLLFLLGKRLSFFFLFVRGRRTNLSLLDLEEITTGLSYLPQEERRVA